MGNQLSDEQRNGIRAAIMNSTCTCNGLDVPWRGMTADQVGALTDNELRVYGKWLDSLTQAAERAAVNNSGNKGNPAGNAGGSGNAGSSGSGSGGYPPPAPPPAPVRPKSMMEALELFGTPEDKAVWNSAVQIHNQKKTDVLAALMAHITDTAQREAVYNFLKDKTIEELNYLQILHQPAPANNSGHQQQAPPIYMGAVGPPPMPVGPDEEPLTTPVYNWEEASKWKWNNGQPRPAQKQ
jgi:hypothetical protein